MGAKSDYLENKILDYIFRGQAMPANPVIYIGLLTAAPSDAGGGTEVTGGSYARVKAAAGASQALTDWKSTQNDNLVSTGTSGQTSNSAAIVFPAPTADWGRVTHFGVYDAAAAGNLLYWAALTNEKNINNGDAAPQFAAGTLVVTED